MDLGASLFARSDRGLALTPEGRASAERVRVGLAFLEEAISAARGASKWRREVVRVAANENVNFFWLAVKVKVRSRPKVEAVFTFAAAAYNLVRLSKLLAGAAA